MELEDVLFYAIPLGIAAFFLFRFLKYGGFRGALYGSRVVRTVGELELGRKAGATATLRVHVLENGDIVLEQSARALLGASINGIPLSRDHARTVAELLKRAADA